MRERFNGIGSGSAATARRWVAHQPIGFEAAVELLRVPAEEPGGSTITVRTRCAANEAELYTALWSDVIEETGPNPCDEERWIQVEVKFQADNLNSAPILDDVTIIWEG